MKDVYNYFIGSIFNDLVESDISNESMIAVLLDVKVIYNCLIEEDQVSYFNFISNIKNIMHEYDDDICVLLNKTINSIYIEKVHLYKEYNYNLLN